MWYKNIKIKSNRISDFSSYYKERLSDCNLNYDDDAVRSYTTATRYFTIKYSSNYYYYKRLCHFKSKTPNKPITLNNST